MRNKRRAVQTLRFGYNLEVTVGNCNLILTTNEYDDGELAEIFIWLKKEGSDLQTMLENFAISISLNLQYGVPLEDLVDKFSGKQFNPRGLVHGHEEIKEVSSIIDFVFQELRYVYIDGKVRKTKVPAKAA